MMRHMDFYNDQGAFLVKLHHAAPLPDFVKTSGYDTDDSVNSLPDSAFASPSTRQYPIHTAADVYVSAAYLHGKSASVDSAVERNIKVAARVFGITKEVDEVLVLAKNYRERTTKVASTPEPWKFATKTATFSGHGPGHLKEAADRFSKNCFSYSFTERTDIARNLHKLAAEMNVTLPDSIEKFAGYAHVDRDQLEVHLQARALALHDARDTREFLGKIAELRNTAEITPEEAMKTAAFLDEFDRQANLLHLYGGRLSDPHSAVFNTPQAEHQEKTASVKIGNVNHFLYDLRRVDGDVFAEILGHKVADVKDLANLNEEQARLVNQLLA
jgi:hypothetical protein